MTADAQAAGAGEATPKRKRGGNPKGYHPVTEWKPGQTGNPFGAPRKGQSHAEIIRTIDAMTAEEVADVVQRCGGHGTKMLERLRTMPKNVTMRTLAMIHARATTITSDEGFASLSQFLADRTDGKVPDKVEVDGDMRMMFRGTEGMFPGAKG